jgi:hypothetical protein
MRFARITVDPASFQKRDNPYSIATVEAIVAEGIVLAKFDPLPLIAPPKGAYDAIYVVGGDGHSRYEALRRLAEAGRLPEEWRVPTPHGDEWDIPHKIVTPAEAKDLAWCGNLRGTSFTPVEEAKVFQEMLEAGIAIDKVATMTHKSEHYIKKSLPLNCLCRDIRAVVGANPDAGGIEKHVAQAMAERFLRFGIGPQVQAELFHKVLKHADLTKAFVEKFLDRVGEQLAEKSKLDDGFLFEIPSTIEAAVKGLKGRAENQRRVERGLAWLLQAQKESTVLAAFPELNALLADQGVAWLRSIKEQTEADATVLGVLVTAA